MKIHELMTPVVQTVSPRNTLRDVAQILFQHDCGMVPIVVEGKPVGVLTDRDVCVIGFNHDKPLSELSVEPLVSEKLFTCGADAEAQQALATLSQRKVRRLVVLDDAEQLVGVVSIDDFAKAAAEGKLDPAEVIKTLTAVSFG